MPPAEQNRPDRAPKSRVAKPRVIVTRRLTPAVEARMATLFDTRFNPDDTPLSQGQLAQAMRECDVLVPTVTDDITADLIAEAGDRLKLIASFGSGVDHIDLKAARQRRILVTNTPGVLTEDTADLTMALILSVPRRLGEAGRLIRSGEWKGWGPSTLLGHRIGGKLLGIVGMGRVGQAVARRARAFGMAVAYHNRHRLPDPVEAETGARYVSQLNDLMAEADVVVVACRLNASSEGLIGRDQIDAMKSSAYFVNIARAEVTDENALIEALEHGRIAGAGFDVYSHEPAVDPRLLALDTVALLPHVGSATFEGRDAAGEKVIANIRVWADGHRPPDQVLDGWV